MKKLIALILTLLLLMLSLISCGSKECYYCLGSGKQDCYILIGSKFVGGTHGYDCDICEGKGVMPCSKCNGTGVLEE